MSRDSASCGRLHLVLVPGFGGFDGLGQLEYYAGTTDVLSDWCSHTQGARWSDRVVLHYFDNLPTAGVRTRATLLRRFLTKRVLRREITRDDRIALIGHSTGGLDIRQLLLDLDATDDEPVAVDGVEDTTGAAPAEARTQPAVAAPRAATPTGAELLALIERVVFLSVPQRGTNIANWTRAQRLSRHLIISSTRTGVDWLDGVLLQTPDVAITRVIERIRQGLAGLNLEHRALDALLALEDVRSEIAGRVSKDAIVAADARAALADLNLWLSQSHGDFLAIDDLACEEAPTVLDRIRSLGQQVAKRALTLVLARPEDGSKSVTSVARATDEERRAEISMWEKHGIVVRSYATLGRCPGLQPPVVSDQVRPLSLALFDALRPRPESDALYQLGHSVCSSGPFVNAMQESRATLFEGPHEEREVEAWENDGVVNTASMLWPNARETRLIHADHGDVIGHFKRQPVEKAAAGASNSVKNPAYTRKYHRYDILQSGSGFVGEHFARLWREIFDFAASVPEPVHPSKAAGDEPRARREPHRDPDASYSSK